MSDNLTSKQLQSLKDEHTVFSLATLMVELYTAVALKQGHKIANTYMKADVVLRNNPGFIERFKKAQKAIIDHVKSVEKPSDILSMKPPTTEILIHEDKPELSSEQIEI